MIIIGNIPEDFKYVLVVLKYKEQYIFVKNKKRNWEFAGGKRDFKESIEEVAVRESWEEAGAKISNIKKIGYYILKNKEKVVIVTAKVNELYEIPKTSEISEISILDELPNHELLSFNDNIYEEIFKLVKNY